MALATRYCGLFHIFRHGTIKAASDIKKGAGKGLVRAKSFTAKIARDGLKVMNR